MLKRKGTNMNYPVRRYLSNKNFGRVFHMPTRVLKVGDFVAQSIQELNDTHRNRHIRTSELMIEGDAFLGREPLFFNTDLTIYKAHINQNMDYHFRNGHHDDLIYIQKIPSHNHVLSSQIVLILYLDHY